MINTKYKIIAAVAVAELLLCAGVNAQIAVVSSSKSSVVSLTKDQAAAIYLGKTSAWPDGKLVKLLDQPESAALNEQFYSKLTGKSQAQVKAVWARLVFSGKATQPQQAPSTAEMKQLVNSNSDAIGYIEKSAVDASVKVLMVLE